MFKFVQDYFHKQEGIKKYKTLLLESLTNNKIDPKDDKKLGELYKSYDLIDKDVLGCKKDAFNTVFDRMIQNRKISSEDKNDIENLLTYFHLTQADTDFDQVEFNKYYSLGLLDEGKFPEVKNNPVQIIYQQDEKLYWATDAKLMKLKHVTTRISYSGPRATMRIMRGLSYRAGYYNISTQSKEFLATEDTGVFWMTNNRLGFKGLRKNFDFPYAKLLSFELSSSGLSIAKEGRETYYMLQMDDYEVPCSVASHILNKLSP